MRDLFRRQRASSRLLRLLLAALLGAAAAVPAAGQVLFDMDSPRHRPTTTGEDQRPIGSVESVPGKFGGACLFRFDENIKSGFFTAGVQAGEDWNRSAGISFWVKGDGSDSWGCLELIDASNYALRYGYCFPIDSTDWQKITVAWRDLVPELPAGQIVDPQHGYAPSNFGNLWFGKWHYWRDYPAHSYAIDQIVLEPAITGADQECPLPTTSGTPRLLEKLRARQPVTIVTMGDSLSDKRHWANREQLWSELLAEKLKTRFGGEVRLVNPAIGGTQLSQNLVLMPRWLKDTPRPDLVTVWFGYNDWDSGMRGEQYRRMLRMAVERVRRMTGGHAEVLLMTTCPALGRWQTMEELAVAARSVAAEQRTGLADMAAAFHEAGQQDAARAALFCWDKTHLGPAGHELAAETVSNAIAGAEAAKRPTSAADAADAASDAAANSTTELEPGRPGPPGPTADSASPPATVSAIPRAADNTAAKTAAGRVVPRAHPRLFGPRAHLQQLARERADAYRRVVEVARKHEADPWVKLVSMSLVSAIELDAVLGRQAVDIALKTVDGPIRSGHVTFGHDLAYCAVVYDLCYEHWTADERSRFHNYVHRTIDANVNSETHVFHNAWYSYKHWGIGLACYASWYENPRAEADLRQLEQDYLQRAAPALGLAGEGGGWAEGYYVNYWLYDWLVFCEVARWCEGVDYYATAPKFYSQRAVAGMFESYPGFDSYHSRRPVPMGDGGGRLFGGDRDKALSARRILVNRYREDAEHQAVHAFNETAPRSSVGVNAYKDFLWRDPSVAKADLAAFRLAHLSRGAGYAVARSSWDEDATYVFFRCADRFTAHQHLDAGHFNIYRRGELAGDGGHYDAFGSPHDVNYHLRTIAHSTILVHDPDEKWPAIRGGRVGANDGGQAHNWPHHNGAVSDPQAWHKDRQLYDIAQLAAYEDTGDYVYIAADCTAAYDEAKLAGFTRQLVFLRPGTLVVFDRVVSRKAEHQKTWLLQAMSRPQGELPHLTITHGQGRLSVQTLLPLGARAQFREGEELYRVDGQHYAPRHETGPAPACRIEISPPAPALEDLFLHVLTVDDAPAPPPQPAAVEDLGQELAVRIGPATLVLHKRQLGGQITVDGQRRPLNASKGE